MVVGSISALHFQGQVSVFSRDARSGAVSAAPTAVINGTALEGQFGAAVALSTDGLTLMVGANGEYDGNFSGGNSSNGAVYVYTRPSIAPGSVWTQTLRLAPTDPSEDLNFGYALAASANASVLAVGCSGEASFAGRVYVYLPNGVTQKLAASDNAGQSLFGYSVALSRDGSLLAAGGHFDNNSTGATWVFVRNPVSGLFSQLQPKLVGSDYDASSGLVWQGASIALSGDGTLLLVGGQFDAQGEGAVWTYARSAASGLFQQAGSKLTSAMAASGTNIGTGALFGSPLALSSNGTRLLVSARLANSGSVADTGATFILSLIHI